jgi:hypothetical protein
MRFAGNFQVPSIFEINHYSVYVNIDFCFTCVANMDIQITSLNRMLTEYLGSAEYLD